MLRPSLRPPTELAEDGGLPALLAEGRDISVELLGCPEDDGGDCIGRAAPYGPPEYGISLGAPMKPPFDPPVRCGGYRGCGAKEESLLPDEAGDSGPLLRFIVEDAG